MLIFLIYMIIRYLSNGTHLVLYYAEIKTKLKSDFMKRIVALLKQEENYTVRGMVIAFAAGSLAAIACFHFFL